MDPPARATWWTYPSTRAAARADIRAAGRSSVERPRLLSLNARPPCRACRWVHTARAVRCGPSSTASADQIRQAECVVRVKVREKRRPENSVELSARMPLRAPSCRAPNEHRRLATAGRSSLTFPPRRPGAGRLRESRRRSCRPRRRGPHFRRPPRASRRARLLVK